MNCENSVPRDPRQKTVWRALLFIVTGVTIWTIFIARFGSNHATLQSGWADLPSNLYSTLIFWDHGLELYKQPTGHFLSPLSDDARKIAANTYALPEGDFFTYHHGEIDRPVFVVWPQVPRPYPPGLYLYLTPVAWLLANDWTNLRSSLVIATGLGLVFAHLAFLVFFIPLWRLAKQSGRMQMFLTALLTSLFYFESIRWTLNSEYDLVAVFTLICFVVAYAKKKHLPAIVLYGLSIFLHLRSIFLLPAALHAAYAWLLSKNGMNALKYIKILDWLAVAAATTMSGLAALTLIWNSPFIKRSDLYDLNGMHWTKLNTASWSKLLPLLLGLIIVFYFWRRQRAYLSMVCSIWSVFVLTQGHLAREWYVLFLFPLVALAILESAKNAKRVTIASLCAGLGFYTMIAAIFLNNSPFEFRLFRDLTSAILGH